MGNSCSPATSESKKQKRSEVAAVKPTSPTPVKEDGETKGPVTKVPFINPATEPSPKNVPASAEVKPRPTPLPTQLSQKQTDALKKIQRQARKRKAIKKATQEQQWKIFADLDVKDEAEMLHLAMFFQTLLDRVPGLDKYGSTRELSYDAMEEDADTYDSTIYLDNIQVEDEGSHVYGDYQNFDIGKQPLTMEIVSKIVEVCRRGGKLHFNTVVKILRSSYKLLKAFPNVRKVTISHDQKVTVVGDIHGNVMDLLYILDDSGMPGPNNTYIFNGDFVDRGDNSVEVICILLALLSACPDNVFLNRGNHEDEAVCRVYGFQNEVIDKYNLLAFEMFSEVFKHMPLATVVNDSVFVLHGGLFHDKDVLIQDLDNITRTDYVAKPEIDYPDNTVNMDESEAKKEYYRQLQRDLLWSDPSRTLGVHPNDRGAGMTFGPDISNIFMGRNNLSMIVRSHECVYNGFHRSYYDEEMNFVNDTTAVGAVELGNPPLVCTLFSASNYCGGDNFGAYLIILPHVYSGATMKSNSGLYYHVRRYKTSVSDMDVIQQKNKSSLSQLILRKKVTLKQAFESIDEGNTGFVTRNVWADTMQKVTQIQIRWLAIIDVIAPAECLTPKMVDYRTFLNSFNPNIHLKEEGASSTIAAMYAQRGKLEAIFSFFDLNGDGVISREEFRQGCEALNASMAPDDYKLTDIDRTLDMMDFDGSDSIDINEFLEVFRILDAKDGKVDGVISLAKTGKK